MHTISPGEAGPAAGSELGPYFVADEVAALLRVSTRTLYNWLAQGRFPPPLPLLGRKRLWSLATVQQWLAGQHAAAEKEVPHAS